MADINALVSDIYEVINRNGGWTETVNEYFKGRVGDTLLSRLSKTDEVRKGTLRMSNLGTPCERKLWYDVNGEEPEELQPHTLFKFLYGDILEDLILSLAVAAGHTVEGEQDEVSILGVKGHRDAVIDGVLIDVKSASPYSFKKFKDNGVREDDPFGYIQQLSSYLYCAQDDPIVKEKSKAGFLVVDKVNGHITLDMYDLTEEMETKEEFVQQRKDMVNSEEMPSRGYEDVPEGKSGNRKLCMQCSYCNHKHSCYPGLRVFLYSRGPVYLSWVEKEPNVKEVT